MQGPEAQAGIGAPEAKTVRQGHLHLLPLRYVRDVVEFKVFGLVV